MYIDITVCARYFCPVHTVPNVTSYFQDKINVCCQFQKTTNLIHMIVKGLYLRIMMETNMNLLKSHKRLEYLFTSETGWKHVWACLSCDHLIDELCVNMATGLVLTECVCWKWDNAATKSFTADQCMETLWSKCVCDVCQHCAFKKIVITWLNHRIVNSLN